MVYQDLLVINSPKVLIFIFNYEALVNHIEIEGLSVSDSFNLTHSFKIKVGYFCYIFIASLDKKINLIDCT